MNIAGMTHAGNVQPQNEDAIFTYGNTPFFAVLADGMGGHSAGKVASSSAVKYIRGRMKEKDLSLITLAEMKEMAESASEQLFRQASADPKLSGMGTTLVFAVVDNAAAKIVSVGDSRAYLLSEGKLTQLTRDHSYVQYLYDHHLLTKDEMRTHPYRNIIMQAVGMEKIEADCYEVPMGRGDSLLLCSDGLTEELDDSEITEILEKKTTARKKAHMLIERALERGGHDNISVIIAENKGIVGEVLQGKYEVQELIAEGGMSRVYKGFCTKTGKDVAIKMFKPEFLKVPEAVEGFKMEAKASAMLHHPNLMHAIDVGKIGKFRYIVSDYVPGVELKEMISQLTLEQSVSIMEKILAGIGHAHRKGVVHHDLKPHNILVDQGNPVIIDFGIAHNIDDTEYPQHQQVLGTVDYFSPEQAKGDHTDVRSDIYSLGVILYELCTGQLPFRGNDDVQVALMHLHQPVVPPIELNPEIPESLNKLILKALEKAPQDRYQTAAAMRQDLQRVFLEPDGEYILLRHETEEKQIRPKILPMLLGVGICAAFMIAVSVLLIRFVDHAQKTDDEISTVYMPYLLDKTEEEADMLLDGYLVEVIYEQDLEAEDGSVIEQSPEAGTILNHGDKITITVNELEKTAEEETAEDGE